MIASGTAGAVAGGVICWLVAPHLTHSEERGRARSDSRKRIAAAVSPVLLRVRQYQAHARSSMGRGPEDHALHVDDLNFCAKLPVTQRLPSPRHRGSVSFRSVAEWASSPKGKP